MNKNIYFLLSLMLIGYSAQQEEYYGYKPCPGFDNNKYLADITVDVVPKVPTAGGKIVGTVTSIPVRR